MIQYATLIYFLCYIHLALSTERELTVNVEPGRESCFYESASKGDVIDIDYQVIDGGHGDLDITFHLVDPTGRILIADYKKPENTHQADAQLDGDYRFCFDNTFSSYNTKSVFFEFSIRGENENEWGSDENIDFNAITPDQVFEIKLNDVQEIINSIRGHLSRAGHLQDLIKSAEARDRNIAEENYFTVNTYSMLQLGLMIFVGIVQVVMVKSLFDDRSRVHKIWKNLD